MNTPATNARFYVWTSTAECGAFTVFQADDRAKCLAFVRALPTRREQDAHFIMERVRQPNGTWI